MREKLTTFFIGIIILGGLGWYFFHTTGLAVGLLLSLLTLFGNSEKVKKEDNNSNNPKLDLYHELLSEIIAICIAADGKIDKEEMSIAISFIKADKLIQNESGVIENFKRHVKSLTENGVNTNPIYKLIHSDIIEKAILLKNKKQKERLLIILDDMCNCNEENQSFIDSIKKVLLQNE